MRFDLYARYRIGSFAPLLRAAEHLTDRELRRGRGLSRARAPDRGGIGGGVLMPRITKVYTRTGDDGTTRSAGTPRPEGLSAHRGLRHGRRAQRRHRRSRSRAGARRRDRRAAASGSRTTSSTWERISASWRKTRRACRLRGIEARHVDGLERPDGPALGVPAAAREFRFLPGGAPGAARSTSPGTVCRRARARGRRSVPPGGGWCSTRSPT